MTKAGGSLQSSVQSSPQRRHNWQHNKKKAHTPLKIQLAEVIHEEENEMTIPKIKERDSNSQASNSMAKKRSVTVDLSLCLGSASPGVFGDDLLKDNTAPTSVAASGIKML